MFDYVKLLFKKNTTETILQVDNNKQREPVPAVLAVISINVFYKDEKL